MSTPAHMLLSAAATTTIFDCGEMNNRKDKIKDKDVFFKMAPLLDPFKYLIGKYTCGAYLFISPTSHQAIGSNAVSPTITKRTVEFGSANSIQIPLIFQYRASDEFQYIGGWRPNQTLQNIRYSKKLGLDIYLKDETFSFDILAKIQYQSETASVTPLSQIAQSGAISQSDLAEVVGGV